MSFSNDDGDVHDNVKKTIAAQFCVHFFAVPARLEREVSAHAIYGRSKRSYKYDNQFFFSFLLKFGAVLKIST